MDSCCIDVSGKLDRFVRIKMCMCSVATYSDRTVCMLGLRVLIELVHGQSDTCLLSWDNLYFVRPRFQIIFYRKALRKDLFTKITFRKKFHADFYGLSNIDSVVTDFDPNS